MPTLVILVNAGNKTSRFVYLMLSNQQTQLELTNKVQLECEQDFFQIQRSLYEILTFWDLAYQMDGVHFQVARNSQNVEIIFLFVVQFPAIDI